MTEQGMSRGLRAVRNRARDVARRGTRAFRGAVGTDEGLQDQLTAAQAEISRLRGVIKHERRALKKQRSAAASYKLELQQSRRSLVDPLPRLDLSDEVLRTIATARAERLTYLGVPGLTMLARQVRDADLSDREGLIIEAGTARGGSAIVMAAAKDPARPMKVYDVFDQIPAPSDADGKDVKARYEKITAGGAQGLSGDTYYGYRDDLHAEVTDSFARLGVPVGDNNVELVKGLFADTIDLDQPVAFAHLDGDWYESTMTCLERIAPLLVSGGRIVLDDYFHWSGCRRAVDEYFADRPGYLLERRNKVHVIKL